MKHLTTFESIKTRIEKLKVGDIFITNDIWQSHVHLTREELYQVKEINPSYGGLIKIIDEVKLIDILIDGNIKILYFKAFTKEHLKEIQICIPKNKLLRKANQEEIDYFNTIETTNKYNL